jgi:hypothetical protein
LSAVHSYIVDAISWLSSGKRQVNQIGLILHARTSPMLALVSKSALDATI